MESEIGTEIVLSPVELYLTSLTTKELQAYIIARNHLGSTFDITKSIGYQRFIQSMSNN